VLMSSNEVVGSIEHNSHFGAKTSNIYIMHTFYVSMYTTIDFA